MAIEEFTTCFANRVVVTVDSLIGDMQAIGKEGIQKFLNWFRGLRDSDRSLVLWLATFSTGVLGGILKLVGGEALAVGIVAFLGTLSWLTLIDAAFHCESQL